MGVSLKLLYTIHSSCDKSLGMVHHSVEHQGGLGGKLFPDTSVTPKNAGWIMTTNNSTYSIYVFHHMSLTWKTASHLPFPWRSYGDAAWNLNHSSDVPMWGRYNSAKWNDLRWRNSLEHRLTVDNVPSPQVKVVSWRKWWLIHLGGIPSSLFIQVAVWYSLTTSNSKSPGKWW